MDYNFEFIVTSPGTQASGCRVRFHNTSATPVTVQWSNAGVPKISGTGTDCRVTHGISGFLTNPWVCESTTNVAVTIPAHEWKTLDYNIIMQQTASVTPVSRVESWVFDVPYFENGVAKSVQFTRSVLVKPTTIISKLVSNTFGYLPIPPPPSSYAGTPGTSFWIGDIVVGGGPATGRIEVRGGVNDTNGSGQVLLYVGGSLKAMEEQTGGVPGSPIPTIIWNSPDPALDEGKKIFVSINGMGYFYEDEIINLDNTGSYSYVIELEAFQMEHGPVLVLGPDGQPLPVNQGVIGDEPDPNNERPTVVPLSDLGSDPAFDTTTGWTPKGEYRAVRAALTDVFNTPYPSFDFAAWAAVPAGDASAEATAGGSALGDGIAAVSSMVGTHTLGIPGDGSTTGIAFHIVGSGAVGYMMPPAWSSLVRTFVLIVSWILFMLAMISIVRGAFAGR